MIADPEPFPETRDTELVCLEAVSAETAMFAGQALPATERLGSSEGPRDHPLRLHGAPRTQRSGLSR